MLRRGLTQDAAHENARAPVFDCEPNLRGGGLGIGLRQADQSIAFRGIESRSTDSTDIHCLCDALRIYRELPPAHPAPSNTPNERTDLSQRRK